METNNVNAKVVDIKATVSVNDNVSSPLNEQLAPTAALNGKDKKKKKKVSAFKAAAAYRSPVGKVSSSSFQRNDFEHTGTNIAYREDGGIA